MASNIDVTQPPQGAATTAAVRANMLAAKGEIEELQARKTQHALVPKGWGARVWVRPSVSMTDGLAGQAILADRLYLIPIPIPCDGTLDAICYNVTTGGAGNAHVALYHNPASPLSPPTTRLWTSGEHSVAAAGLRTFLPALAVKAGDMLYAALHASVAVSISAMASWESRHILPSELGNPLSPRTRIFIVRAYGAPPDVIAPTSANLDYGPTLIFPISIV